MTTTELKKSDLSNSESLENISSYLKHTNIQNNFEQKFESSMSNVIQNKDLSNLIEMARLKYAPNVSYFKKTQKWLGHVTEIKSDEFIAELKDLTNPGTIEIGEFEINEISAEDKELLTIGSAFYWSVGYAVEKGQVKKESIIRFQRIYWEQDELDSAFDRARILEENLNWD